MLETDIITYSSITVVRPHLSLLADDGDSILQLHVMEKALEKNVGHSDQVVVFVCLIERIRLFTISFVVLEEKRRI